MMNTDWITMLPLKVFTAIKTEFPQSVKDAYNMTDKNFSTVGSSDTPAVFPFVSFQILPGSEQGQDLEAKDINAGAFGFQIDVYDNQTQTRARKVMNEVTRILKSKGFQINSMPSFEDTKDVHRMIMRARKSFGSNDVF